MREIRNADKISVGKLEGKEHFGRPRRKWKVNITMDLKEIRCGVVDRV
jgi:hypothetical protein